MSSPSHHCLVTFDPHFLPSCSNIDHLIPDSHSVDSFISNITCNHPVPEVVHIISPAVTDASLAIASISPCDDMLTNSPIVTEMNADIFPQMKTTQTISHCKISEKNMRILGVLGNKYFMIFGEK